MATVESKTCSRCKQTLVATAFSADRRASTGLQPACKKCFAAAAKAGRYRDIEAHRAKQREYCRSNPEKIRQYYATERERHIDKINARAKAYYEANKERHSAWTKAGRKKNPARTRELARGWQATRRALKKGGASAVETASWFKGQKKICHWCGKPCAKNAEIDHIVPLSRGGPHEITNLCVACLPCNRSKHNKDPIDFAQSLGLLL